MSKPKRVFCSQCGTTTNVANKNDLECTCKKCSTIIEVRKVKPLKPRWDYNRKRLIYGRSRNRNFHRTNYENFR